MLVLFIGLLLFLGIHSTRVVAEGWRQGQIARRGERAWKGVYTLVSLLGLALTIWGYGLAREQPTVLWPAPPTGLKHLASLLTLLAFVLLTAAYVPGNAIKARLKHPMVLSVKVWALAHLLVNNTLADVLLFGSFLLWAVFCFRAARGRDRVAGLASAGGAAQAAKTGAVLPTVLTVVIGVVLWAAFAFWAHGAWIGVRPFGR